MLSCARRSRRDAPSRRRPGSAKGPAGVRASATSRIPTRARSPPDALPAWPALGDLVDQGREVGCHLAEGLGVRGDDRSISNEQRQIGFDRLVPRVHLAESPAKAAHRVVDRRQSLEVRHRMSPRPVLGAGSEERAVVREVRIDGVPLDARPLGDPADRRPRGTDARMQLDCGLDDPLPCLRLAARPLFQFVLPIHCTEVYRES